MKKYILKRVLMAVLTLLLTVLVLFLLLNLMPGSPFQSRHLTDDMKQVLYEKYGLDKPILTRYFIYLKNLLKGDFGISMTIQKNMEISKMLSTRFPLSIRIGLQGMLLGTVLGILLGVIGALKHNTWLDPVISAISMIGASVPSFIFALGLMYFIAYKLGAAPLLYSGELPFKSTILPSISLAMFPMSNIARYTRTEMISVLSSDYIKLAMSKGISTTKIILRHAMRNALIPVLTIMAPMLVELITGSMVVEGIYSIPGIGSLFIAAIKSNDYNITISIMFIYTAVYIGLMLIVDLLYGLIDPRVRLGKES
ncbi:MAG: ABC transporter permease [Lachnospiraceae bacterium]|nr:ABC transporter permease [Lachnospiraceae bacterium]